MKEDLLDKSSIYSIVGLAFFGMQRTKIHQNVPTAYTIHILFHEQAVYGRGTK